MISKGSENNSELKQILSLQSKNLETNITKEELKSQGFVTVKHNLELLQEMSREYPHVIAVDNDEVIGYALVMLKRFSDKIPVLVPMFEMIDRLEFQSIKLANANYFVMGHICIEKDYRGRGVFQGLYRQMKNQLKNHFDFVITEVATRNQRSLAAHSKVGFKSILKYRSELGEEWDILLWGMS